MRPGIPVIDLFAGPGGLGEGFASLKDEHGRAVFRIAMSIEKDAIAVRTLRLRAAFRFLRERKLEDIYYMRVRGEIDEEEFLSDRDVIAAFAHADREVRCAELGKHSAASIDKWITTSIGHSKNWILIGGPPCQAYSMAGRSRRTNDSDFEEDEKHFLYREYLRILRKFAPPVFVMENVKGMLSTTHGGFDLFPRILADLQRPSRSLQYEIRSFTEDAGSTLDPSHYVIRSESHGVPQARHRVFLLGVRHDRKARRHILLQSDQKIVTVSKVIGSLPRVRSRLSSGTDTVKSWRNSTIATAKKLRGWKHKSRADIERNIAAAVSAGRYISRTGAPFIPKKFKPLKGNLPPVLDWIIDRKIGGVLQHEARSHMAADLRRYMFLASFAAATGQSPKLGGFPARLLPKHTNVSAADTPFGDRFRVQRRNQPGSTVVSHIAKDGHYYIHYDAGQCRSLTVREAARLQTFPDNYYFEGNRTEQYQQVGNAVPPYLACQIAESVASLLPKARLPK